MNIKDSTRLMNLAMKSRVPFLLVGHSGIGKTQITEAESKKIFPNHKFVTVMASQQDVGDFIGIPDIIKLETTDEKGKKKVERVTSWARPEWMPYEPCVIFLDELNNARPDVESAMLQLVLEKRIHTHNLHPDSYICAAVNPASSEYTTANNMSTALVKRFMVISFEPQASEFIKWGEDTKRINPTILSFLKHHPVTTGAEKKLDTLIKLEECPRLWEAVSKIYTVIESEGNQTDRDLIRDMLISVVGVKSTGLFLNWLDTQDKPLSFKEIVSDPKASIKRFDGFYEGMHNDMISSSVENVVKGIQAIHEQVIDKINYKVSVLEIERNSDPKQVDAAKKELQDLIKNNAMGEYQDQLDNVVTFLKKVPNDIMFQVSQAILTYKPFHDKVGSEDAEAYHEKQIKRFNAYNTVCLYLYREDLFEGRKNKSLYNRFIEATEEVNKHKKKAEKE